MRLNTIRFLFAASGDVPAGHEKECNFKTLLCWLHFTNPESLSTVGASKLNGAFV